MVNLVILVGRIGKDPIINQAGKTQVAKFSLATDEKRKDPAGNWQTKTEWHNITAWGKLADICERYLGKGSLVYVEGKLQTNEWDDKKTGEKRRQTEVVAQVIRMLDSKQGAENDSQADLPDAAGSQKQSKDPIKAQIWKRMKGKRLAREESNDFWYWATTTRKATPQYFLDNFEDLFVEWKDYRERDQAPLDDDIPF